MVSSDRHPGPERPHALLDAILDRLIPADEAPGALDLELGPSVRSRVPELDNLLDRLGSFTSLPLKEQEDTLRRLDDEEDPTFQALVMTVHELYYADSRAWPAIGYARHVPGT